MFEKIRYWWHDFILGQWNKYFVVGGHCGLCGKWVPTAVVYKGWEWTVCPDWETECWHTRGSALAVKKGVAGD